MPVCWELATQTADPADPKVPSLQQNMGKSLKPPNIHIHRTLEHRTLGGTTAQPLLVSPSQLACYLTEGFGEIC